MVKAIIFDLDGIIIDSDQLHKQSASIMFRSLGLSRAQHDLAQLDGMRDRDIFRRLKEKYHLTLNGDDVIRKRLGIFLSLARRKLRLKKGFIRLVRQLKSRFKLAVTTSSQKEVWQLADAKFHLSRYFDVVMTGDDCERGKPYPDPYLKTCHLLGVDPTDCIVIEDALCGVQAAKRAGAKCIAVTADPNHPMAKEADYVVTSLSEIDQAVLDQVGNN